MSQDNRLYLLYAHINKVNNKMYAGITSHQSNPNLRWANGAGYKESPRFYNAIKKYGWDGFWHIIIKRNMTLEEANQAEIKFIEDFRLRDMDYGYNLAEGGGRPAYIDHSLTEDIKKKIGKASKQRWNNMTSEERKYWEEKSVMNLPPSGANSPNAKKAMCIETGEVFGCIVDAAKTIYPDNPQKAAGHIGGHCNHPDIWKSAYGKHWKFLE